MRVSPLLCAPMLALLLAGCAGGGSGSASSAATPISTTAPAPAPAPTPTTTAALYPSYNQNPAPADTTGMSHNAQQIASSIRIGFNNPSSS